MNLKAVTRGSRQFDRGRVRQIALSRKETIPNKKRTWICKMIQLEYMTLRILFLRVPEKTDSITGELVNMRANKPHAREVCNQQSVRLSLPCRPGRTASASRPPV